MNTTTQIYMNDARDSSVAFQLPLQATNKDPFRRHEGMRTLIPKNGIEFYNLEVVALNNLTNSFRSTLPEAFFGKESTNVALRTLL